MAAPAFGTIGAKFGSTTSTPAFAVPASVASGDIVIAAFFFDVGTATITAVPTGFAAVPNMPHTVNAGGSEGFGMYAAWKRATAGDTGTYGFTLSASVFVYGYALRYTTCVATGSPWDATAVADNGATQSTNCPVVSLTTLGPDRMLVYLGYNWNGDGGTWTAPSSFNQRAGGASVANIEISDLAQAATGGTGNVNASNNTAGGGTVGSWLGALIGTTVVASPSVQVVNQPAVARSYSW